MTLVIVKDETLQSLWKYRVNQGLKSHDKAIADLLQKAQQNEPTTSA